MSALKIETGTLVRIIPVRGFWKRLGIAHGDNFVGVVGEVIHVEMGRHSGEPMLYLVTLDLDGHESWDIFRPYEVEVVDE